MKKTTTLLVGAIWFGAMCVATAAAPASKIQFDKTVYDFGKITNTSKVSGIYKFKNVGDATLILEKPIAYCGCTVPELSTNSFAPGASGELSFTWDLGFTREVMEKMILVKSNDPKTPEVTLTNKVDYTPLYELSPMGLSAPLAFGMNSATQYTTLTRNDGKPLAIAKLVPSKPWITATVEPGGHTNATTARIRIAVRREGPPQHYNEYIQLYTAGETNIPISTIQIYVQVAGEVAMSPEALYWSVTSGVTTAAATAESQAARKITIRSANGKPMTVKNPQSTIKGLKVELVPLAGGVSYELTARLEQNPAATVSGNVTFETSVAAQPVMTIPVIVNVFKP